MFSVQYSLPCGEVMLGAYICLPKSYTLGFVSCQCVPIFTHVSLDAASLFAGVVGGLWIQGGIEVLGHPTEASRSDHGSYVAYSTTLRSFL